MTYRWRRSGSRLGILLLLCATSVAALALLPRTARACMAGHRIRLFPLGTVGQELLVAEIEERRYPLGLHSQAPLGSANQYWVGELRVRRATPRGRLKPGGIKLGRTVARSIYYYLDTRRAVDRALKRAHTVQGFRPLGKPTLQSCVKESRCGPWRLRLLGQQLWVQGAGVRGVLLDRRSTLAMAKKKFSYGMETGDDRNLGKFLRFLGSLWTLTYAWDNRQILVAPVSGGFSDTLGLAVGWRQGFCRSVRTCIPPAGVYDHEVARDGLVVLPFTPASPAARKGAPKP